MHLLGLELPVYFVERARRTSVADRCMFRFSANDALQVQVTHQARNCAPDNRNILAMQLRPDFPNIIDTEMPIEDIKDFGLENFIPSFVCEPALRVVSFPQPFVVGRWGDLQHSIDRFDPIFPMVIINEHRHLRNERSSSA